MTLRQENKANEGNDTKVTIGNIGGGSDNRQNKLKRNNSLMGKDRLTVSNGIGDEWNLPMMPMPLASLPFPLSFPLPLPSGAPGSVPIPVPVSAAMTIQSNEGTYNNGDLQNNENMDKKLLTTGSNVNNESIWPIDDKCAKPLPLRALQIHSTSASGNDDSKNGDDDEAEQEQGKGKDKKIFESGNSFSKSRSNAEACLSNLLCNENQTVGDQTSTVPSNLLQSNHNNETMIERNDDNSSHFTDNTQNKIKQKIAQMEKERPFVTSV
ncbi:hypothetical protein RFI_08975 [Reticulomyxa filosa]|uniref:Uncharacterized protein n=1 Tax=Reticulomyxa filosa TaxID=46433 RepID=X6NQ54_RETFI|nr:hypothetical protein RFI_08975 [Reticulomyxa filosa]|eukprot:ETO28156.1 hypothetical protein RFI_08975 [Reticulomyxa filosa]